MAPIELCKQIPEFFSRTEDGTSVVAGDDDTKTLQEKLPVSLVGPIVVRVTSCIRRRDLDDYLRLVIQRAGLGSFKFSPVGRALLSLAEARLPSSRLRCW